MWQTLRRVANAQPERTLALIEVLFAQAMSKKVFAQDTSLREKSGMALIVASSITLVVSEKRRK